MSRTHLKNGSATTGPREEHEGATDSQMSFRGKAVRTAAVFGAALAPSMCIGMIGPALLDLQLLTGTSTSEIALIFTVRGVMGLLSSIATGPIFDKFDRYLVCGIALLINFVLTGAAPWSTNLAGILITLGLPALTGFTALIGTTLICLDIWKDDAGPILQALNFVGILGIMVSPLIVQPFLSVKEEQGDKEDVKESSKVTLQSLIREPSQATMDTSTESPNGMTRSTDLETIPNTTYNFNVTNKDNVTSTMGYLSDTVSSCKNWVTTSINFTPVYEAGEQTTDVKYAIWIIALFCLVTGVIMLGIFVYSGHKPIRHAEDEKDEDDKHRGNSKSFVIIVGILVFVFNIFYGGVELGYAGLLMTFAVDHLGWSKTDGTWLVTLQHGSTCFITGLSIFLSKFVRPNVLLGIDIVILNVALLIETLLVDSYDAVLWACAVGVGIGYGIVMPCTLTWLDEVVGFGSKFSSVHWTGYCLGYMTLPALSGYLFNEVGELWFIYINLVSAVAMAVMFMFMSIFIYKQSLSKAQDTRL